MSPLSGVRVVEIAGLGPGPFCGMMLADMGADVLVIDRPGARIDAADPLQRSRTRLTLDLKTAAGCDALLTLVEKAEVLFEGFRPGVAERLGFGPEVCLARNPALVYGRMTGWGQEGPLAKAAGHDINYIALSGALMAIGREGEPPVPPLNLLGDFGGGGMMLAFGIVCALLESKRSGQGQVVDAAMVDGSVALMAMMLGLRNQGLACDAPGTHLFSGAAHAYGCYETQDGKYISIAPIEPAFYEQFIDKLGLDRERFVPYALQLGSGNDPRAWADLKKELTRIFKTRTRDEWCALLEGSDSCFAPVLSLSEAPVHTHNRTRGNFVEVEGVVQNAPAPRFSRTPPRSPTPSATDAQALENCLVRWGVDAAGVSRIQAAIIGG